MQNETLREYLGKSVEVVFSFTPDIINTIYGKISEYDNDFVKLNPFWRETGCHSDSIRKMAIEGDKTYDAGATDTEILLNRKIIHTIEGLIK